MCASSIAQHFLPKNTLGRQITNLSSLSKLFFLKHERGPTWEKKKEKEKKGNRVVVVVCMIVA